MLTAKQMLKPLGALLGYSTVIQLYLQLGMGTMSLSSVSLEILGCEGGAGQMRLSMI